MKNKKYISSAVWLFLVIIAGLGVLYFNGVNLINSDDAGEMILAQLLSEGNGIVTGEWVYSSELRVINTQLIRSFLFRFTDNWTAVHIIGNIALYAWLLLSYAFFMRQLTGSIKWFWYTAPFLLIPFSHVSFYVIGQMGYYIPHISLSFLILGLWMWLYKEKKYRRIVWGALICISFASCLGGIRQLLVTFVPAAAAAISLLLGRFSRSKDLKCFVKANTYIWVSLLAGAAGYLINIKILSRFFVFDTYSQIWLRSPGIDRIHEIWIRLLDAFGYSETGISDTLLFSVDGIFYLLNIGFMALILMIIAFLWKQRKRLNADSEFLLWFSLWGAVLQSFLFLFTDTSVQSRYYILNIIMYVPLLAVFYRETDYSVFIRKGLLISAALCVSLLGLKEYSACLEETGNKERMASIEYLEKEGYTFGYGTFWNCNVVTELTEGKIEMVPFTGGKGEEYSLYPWLVKMDNLFLDDPVEPVFLLLHYNELNRNQKLIQDAELVYEDGSYYIYRYDSSDEFLELFNQE